MFKTKREKYAYVQGIKKGNRGGKPWGRKPKQQNGKKKTPPAGAYTPRGRINENLVDDRHGPVVFWEDFEFGSKGRIKGSYTPDGKFEPD